MWHNSDSLFFYKISNWKIFLKEGFFFFFFFAVLGLYCNKQQYVIISLSTGCYPVCEFYVQLIYIVLGTSQNPRQNKLVTFMKGWVIIFSVFGVQTHSGLQFLVCISLDCGRKQVHHEVSRTFVIILLPLQTCYMPLQSRIGWP